MAQVVDTILGAVGGIMSHSVGNLDSEMLILTPIGVGVGVSVTPLFDISRYGGMGGFCCCGGVYGRAGWYFLGRIWGWGFVRMEMW